MLDDLGEGAAAGGAVGCGGGGGGGEAEDEVRGAAGEGCDGGYCWGGWSGAGSEVVV